MNTRPTSATLATLILSLSTTLRWLVVCCVVILHHPLVAFADAFPNSPVPNVDIDPNCGGENEPTCSDSNRWGDYGIFWGNKAFADLATHSVSGSYCDYGLAKRSSDGLCVDRVFFTDGTGRAFGRRSPEVSAFAGIGSWNGWAIRRQSDLQKLEALTWAQRISTHNSFSSLLGGNPHAPFPNQYFSLTDQLNIGVRDIEIDVHQLGDDPTAIYACHGNSDHDDIGCEGGTTDRPYYLVIKELRDWLDDFPSQAITLRLERGDLAANPAGYQRPIDLYLGDKVLKPTDVIIDPETRQPVQAKEYFLTKKKRLPSLFEMQLLIRKQVIILDDWGAHKDTKALQLDYDTDLTQCFDKEDSMMVWQPRRADDTIVPRLREARTLSDIDFIFGAFAGYLNKDLKVEGETTLVREVTDCGLTPGFDFINNYSKSYACGDTFFPDAECLNPDLRLRDVIWSWAQNNFGSDGPYAYFNADVNGPGPRRWGAFPDGNSAHHYTCGPVRNSLLDPKRWHDWNGVEWYVTTAFGPWDGGDAACLAETAIPPTEVLNAKIIALPTAAAPQLRIQLQDGPVCNSGGTCEGPLTNGEACTSESQCLTLDGLRLVFTNGLSDLATRHIASAQVFSTQKAGEQIADVMLSGPLPSLPSGLFVGDPVKIRTQGEFLAYSVPTNGWQNNRLGGVWDAALLEGRGVGAGRKLWLNYSDPARYPGNPQTPTVTESWTPGENKVAVIHEVFVTDPRTQNVASVASAQGATCDVPTHSCVGGPRAGHSCTTNTDCRPLVEGAEVIFHAQYLNPSKFAPADVPVGAGQGEYLFWNLQTNAGNFPGVGDSVQYKLSGAPATLEVFLGLNLSPGARVSLRPDPNDPTDTLGDPRSLGSEVVDTKRIALTVENLPPVVTAPEDVPQSALIPVPNATDGSRVLPVRAFRFTDPGGAGDGPFVCKINWGDGSLEQTPASCDLGVDNNTFGHVFKLGEFTVTISVTDKDGATSTDSFTVSNKPVSSVPLAFVQGCPNVTLVAGSTFSCSPEISNFNGDTPTVKVDFGDGNGEVDLTSSVGALSLTRFYVILTFTYTTPGTYTIKLTATNTTGEKATSSFTVEVVAPTSNTPPVVYDSNNNKGPAFSASTGSEGVPFSRTFQIDDPDNTVWVVFVRWIQINDDSNPVEHFFVSRPAGTSGRVPFTLMHTYAQPGTYLVNFAVRECTSPTLADCLGAFSRNSFAVTVGSTNTPPVLNLDTTGGTVNEGATFTRSGSFTDPDVNDPWLAIVNYGDGTVASLPLAINKAFSLNHIYADNGTYTITILLTDGEQSVSRSFVVIVLNVAPTPNAGADQTANRNQTVTVTGTWTDPAGAADNPYTWNWALGGASDSGSANYGTAITRSTSFATEGQYTLSFQVTDKDGGTNTDTLTVTVLNRTPSCTEAFPNVSTLWPPNHALIPITLSGLSDPEGDPVAVRVDSVWQDEPTNGLGDGDTSPDATGLGSATVNVRAERAGKGNGRVYHLRFTGTDGHGGSCTGEVTVSVPKSQSTKDAAIDDGARYNSAGQ